MSFAEPPNLFTLAALEEELSALVNVPVDVVLRTALTPRIGGSQLTGGAGPLIDGGADPELAVLHVGSVYPSL